LLVLEELMKSPVDVFLETRPPPAALSEAPSPAGQQFTFLWLNDVLDSKLFFARRAVVVMYFDWMPKALTRERVQARKDQPVRFIRDVVVTRNVG
jgi:hypothetical protein